MQTPPFPKRFLPAMVTKIWSVRHTPQMLSYLSRPL